MLTFNASEREVCIVRKDQTITPLQALTLMNNVTFVEAARHLAERIMTQEDLASEDERITYAFKAILSRPPSSRELALLKDDFIHHEETFSRNPKAVGQLLKVGEKPNDPKLPSAALAAYAMVASTILNLDEAISLN
jgi:hypothetical protein